MTSKRGCLEEDLGERCSPYLIYVGHPYEPLFFLAQISSTSNCTDYQARRMHITYMPSSSSNKPAKQAFAHTLNGTAAAIPRLIVALLENGARLDGGGGVLGVDLPKSLEPFWFGTKGDRIRFV